ncbi:hypothetical protein FS837_011874 [Tulasnella sp. UAMH 9824]|nr:hypothetical protein FS837_011874 [Tulasnella sp. UAMH 9824]
MEQANKALILRLPSNRSIPNSSLRSLILQDDASNNMSTVEVPQGYLNVTKEFEKLLKAAVGGKRLSQSKMTALTELALNNFEHDTQLVSILYRTHKGLATEGKVPSLYVFDSLARAARSRATQSRADPKSSVGNAATFLAKIEGVLDGLIKDMIATGTTEAKEKTLKVLDIWTKANTFPAPVLARLTGYTRDSTHAATDNANSQPSPVTVDPRKPPTPPDQSGSAALYQAPVPDTSGLLALLAQAQATAGPAEANSHSNAPSTPTVGIDSTQLAFLQQLAGNLSQPAGVSGRRTTALHTRIGLLNLHTLATTVQITLGVATTIARPHLVTEIIALTGMTTAIGGGVTVIEVGSTIVKPSPIDVEEGRMIEIMSEAPRAEGGGMIVVVTLPGEEVDHHSETDTANHRTPPLVPRYLNVLAKARLFKAQTRHVKVRSARTPAAGGALSPAISTSAIPSFEPQADKPSDGPSGGTASQSVDGQGAFGLHGYDFTKFDPTNPASWDSLGKAWEVSYGKPPTQEELMMFVMTGGMSATGGMPSTGEDTAAAETNQIPTWDGAGNTGGQSWNGQQQNFQNQRGRGRGRGRGYGYNRGGYGAGRDGRNGFGDDGYGGASYLGSSDAVVLGGGDNSSPMSPTAYGGSHSMSPSSNSMSASNGAPSANTPLSGTVATKGQMVKVGDKWKWVKAGDIIP